MTPLDRLAADQPDTVKAVLLLASMRPEMLPADFDLILDAFCPQHADTLREIATELAWINDLRSDPPVEVLRRLFDQPTARFLHPDRFCDEIADAKETSVLVLSQAVATLLGKAVAA